MPQKKFANVPTVYIENPYTAPPHYYVRHEDEQQCLLFMECFFLEEEKRKLSYLLKKGTHRENETLEGPYNLEDANGHLYELAKKFAKKLARKHKCQFIDETSFAED